MFVPLPFIVHTCTRRETMTFDSLRTFADELALANDHARIKLLPGYLAFPEDGFATEASAQTNEVRACATPCM